MSKAIPLEQLREQKESLQLQAEIRELRHGLRLLEAVGDFIDPRWQFEDDYGRPTVPAGHLSDRLDGANAPSFRTEDELRVIRGQARMIADSNSYCVGVLSNLTNYVVGTGYTYTAVARTAAAAVPAGLVEAVQRVIDEFQEENGWDEWERELFRRCRRDGEFFLGFSHVGGGHVQVRAIEPEQIVEPARPPIADDVDRPATSWSFGVRTDADDVQTVLGYSVLWDPASEPRYLPAERLQHCKVNVDRNVKRGLSDFFPVTADLEGARKLLRNTREGAAIQAAIAFIRQFPAGTRKDTVQALNAGQTDFTRARFSQTSGGRFSNIHRFEAGTILNIPAGQEYLAGPLGSQRAPNFMLVLQGALRGIAVRWSMPEAMISGDASNANYASSLVAEGPFVKAVEAAQRFYACRYRDTHWRAIRIAAEAGRFRRFGVQTLRPLIELQVEPPTVAVRNRAEETRTRSLLHEKGILSRRTWAALEELDYDVEQENILRERSPERSAPADTGANANDPDASNAITPAAEIANQQRQDMKESNA